MNFLLLNATTSCKLCVARTPLVACVCGKSICSCPLVAFNSIAAVVDVAVAVALPLAALQLATGPIKCVGGENCLKPFLRQLQQGRGRGGQGRQAA